MVYFDIVSEKLHGKREGFSGFGEKNPFDS